MDEFLGGTNPISFGILAADIVRDRGALVLDDALNAFAAGRWPFGNRAIIE